MAKASIGKAMSLALLAAGTGAVFGAMPAQADVAVTVGGGTWQRVFTTAMEVMVGRRVAIDVSSYAAGGLGKRFRQAEVLLRNEGNVPRGSTVYSQHSVNCATGQSTIHGWTTVGPTGAVLSSQTIASPQIATLQWDSADGRVLGFVCRGIKPH